MSSRSTPPCRRGAIMAVQTILVEQWLDLREKFGALRGGAARADRLVRRYTLTGHAGGSPPFVRSRCSRRSAHVKPAV